MAHTHSQRGMLCALMSFVLNLLFFMGNNNCLARCILINTCPYRFLWQEPGFSTCCQSCGQRNFFAVFVVALVLFCFVLQKVEGSRKHLGSHSFCRWAIQHTMPDVAPTRGSHHCCTSLCEWQACRQPRVLLFGQTPLPGHAFPTPHTSTLSSRPSLCGKLLACMIFLLLWHSVLKLNNFHTPL